MSSQTEVEERENTFLEELLNIYFCHIKIRYDSMTELCDTENYIHQ